MIYDAEWRWEILLLRVVIHKQTANIMNITLWLGISGSFLFCDHIVSTDHNRQMLHCAAYSVWRETIMWQTLGWESNRRKRATQMTQRIYTVSRFTLKFSFPVESWGGSALAACDEGGVKLRLTAAGVDLNNECHWTTDGGGGGLSRAKGPSTSGPAVRVYLALLLVFLRSLEGANTPLHYLAHAVSLNLHENSDKTKHLQLAVSGPNLPRRVLSEHMEGL